MRKSLGFVIVSCWIAGCSESAPVSPEPSDSGDVGIADLGVETSTDATIPSDGDAAPSDVEETGDATTLDSDVLPDTSDADETSDTADAVDSSDAADVDETSDVTATSDATDSSDAADTTDTSVDDASDAVATDASDAGSAPAELWVVRVGDGATALDFSSAPVAIDRLQLSSGTVVGSMTLPTVASGSEKPFTLPGRGTESGYLIRSADRRFVTMAGYAAAPGVADVNASPTSAVLRVVARIDATGAISTSTTTTAYDSNGIISAVTDNGTRFWLAGLANGIQFLDGFGGPITATSIPSGALDVHAATIIGGTLYGAQDPAPQLFTFSTPLPTTSTSTVVALPGGTTSSTPPSLLIGFSRSGSETDLLYVCNGASVSSGGGLKRWTKTSGTWSLSATIPVSTTAGCRSVEGTFNGTTATLYAVTAQSTASLVTLTDDPASSTTWTRTTLLTATSTKAIRGIAYAPVP
jgi:hypothetical protein